MFEGIPFQIFSGGLASADLGEEVLKNPTAYARFLQKNEAPDPNQEDYQLDGRTWYLLSRPMLPERKAAFPYIQSFCYMESGSQYYTRREGFPSYLILYTYRGKGILACGGTEYPLSEGEGFLIDCRKPHLYRTNGPVWAHGDLHINGGNLDYLYQSVFASLPPLFRPASPDKFQSALTAALRAHTDLHTDADFAVSVLLGDLLLQIRKGLTSPAAPIAPESIQDVQQYIARHFTEDISLDTLTGVAHLSKYHLIRQFQKYTGFTPHEYLVSYRLSQAEFMLQNTDLPAWKIGVLVGFSSEANFISSFKRAYGQTPGQARGARRAGGTAANPGP